MSLETPPSMPALLDRAYLDSVEAAIGTPAMRDIVGTFLRDCATAKVRVEHMLGAPEGDGLAKEAHRLGGMLAQFGCPAAAVPFRQASRCKVGAEMTGLIRTGLSLLEPTLEAIQDYSKQRP